MYRLLNKLNDRYQLLTKDDYKDEFSFMWNMCSALIIHSIYSTVINILSLCGIILIFVPLILLGVLILPWFPGAVDIWIQFVDTKRMYEQKILSLFLFGGAVPFIFWRIIKNKL